METAEEIAARYGAVLAPGAEITRCAVGISSRPYPVWDEAKQRLVDGRTRDEIRAEMAGAAQRSIRANRRKKALEDTASGRLVLLKRRISAAWTANKTLDEIAAAEGITAHSARMYLVNMGHHFEWEPRKRERNRSKEKATLSKRQLAQRASAAQKRKAREERAARAIEMRMQGIAVEAIANALGAPYSTIQRDLREAGVKVAPIRPRMESKSPAEKAEDMKTRRAELRRMLDAGEYTTMRDASRKFGVVVATISTDIRAIKKGSGE